MPTYEYRCPGCGAEFEQRKHVSQRASAECSACGQDAVLRVSQFNYNGLATHQEWSDVAPVDDEGKLMSRGEAVRSGQFMRHDPYAPLRANEKREHDNERHREHMFDLSMKEAWAERKVVIR